MGWVVCQNLNDSINIPQGCKKSEYILYQGHHCSSNEIQLARMLAVKGASQPKLQLKLQLNVKIHVNLIYGI